MYVAATGNTYFTWLGPVPSITIMNPQLIKEVFNKVYDFPKTHTFPLLALITDGLANADGDKWARHRRIINPAFHFEKIKVSRFSFSNIVKAKLNCFWLISWSCSNLCACIYRIWSLRFINVVARLCASGRS